MTEQCVKHGQYSVFCELCDDEEMEKYSNPPCIECGAMTSKEAETKCKCGGDKDDCHGCSLWPDS